MSRPSTASTSCSIAARELWASLPGIEDEAQRRFETRLTFRLIHLADIEAVTASA